MELKDFIKEAIKDIAEAIKESNEELSEIGVITNPRNVASIGQQEGIYGHTFVPSQNNSSRPVHLLSFDIAVSSAEKKNGKEGIGVNVVGIALGKNGEKISESNTDSRLKFTIPIAFPIGKN